MNDVRWRNYWRFLTCRFRREVSDELAFHVEMRTAELVRQGIDAEAAAREAERRFGDRSAVQARLEHLERKRGGRMAIGFFFEELWQDIRYGARGLLKRPGFTLLTATSLALGIAAVTVVLSMVDSWLLRPLPVPRPKELVVVGATTKLLNPLVIPGISLSTIRDVEARHDLFRGVAGVRMTLEAVRDAGADRGDLRFLLVTTGNYLSLLEVRPHIGRIYTRDDDERREPVLVLTHRYWTTRLGADPSVIGRTEFVNGTPFTIVGVAAAGFQGTEQMIDPVGFMPVGAHSTLRPAQQAQLTERTGNFQIVARRPESRSLPSIQAALDLLSRQLTAAYPELGEGYRLIGIPETRARPTISASGGVVVASVIFSALAVLVLLAACINATNLVLARATTRWTELVVRQALGASRSRLIRQLLTETVLLAGIGLGIGAVLARLAVGWLQALPLPGGWPLTLAIEFDARIFGWAVLVTLVAGIVAGVGPAVVGSRFNLQLGIKQGGRGMGAKGARGRAVLVVAQVAAATVVLIAAGLFQSSMRRAAVIDLGLKADHVLTVELDASLARYDAARAQRAYATIERTLRDLPGVEAVAWATGIPLSQSTGDFTDIYFDNPDVVPTNKAGGLSVLTTAVGPAYFRALGIPILEGRAFTERDDSAGRQVAIVNQHAARTLWPGKSPIGRMVRLTRDGPPIEVVGVARDGRYVLLGESQRPYLYLALAQRPSTYGLAVIRTAGAPEALIPTVREAIAAVDKDLVPFGLATMEQLVNGFNGLFPLRLGAVIASAVGLLALILTVVGLYGVIAYSVTQRTQEIGLRMALGADQGVVVRGVLRQGATLAGIGIALGVIVAGLLSRTLGNLLVGVSTTDASVFATVVLGLGALAAGAAYIPARRAARLDPVRALRSDG